MRRLFSFRPTALCFLILLIPVFLYAGEDEIPGGDKGFRFFPAGPLFNGYISESLSTVNSLEIQWVNKAPPGYPWPEGYGNRPLVDIRLGMEVPVVGGRSGHWAWYFGFPIGLHFITDMFQPDTAPVVNTDYWFGTRFEILYDLEISWPGNIGLRLLPVYHESTHLGDEVSLFWSQNDPGYYRINVSYEAWEATLCLNEWNGGADTALTLRIGLSGLWNGDGYYSLPDDEEYGTSYASGDFFPSRGRLEFLTQLQLQVPEGFPAIGKWEFQGGVEVRNRILLDYFSNAEELRAWTVTSSLGWYRYPENWKGRYMGFHLRILAGQNPHGQYREQYGYFSIGTGFSLGL